MHLGVEEAARQGYAHVLPRYQREACRRQKLETAATNDWETLSTANAGLQVNAKWLMSSDLLGWLESFPAGHKIGQ